MDFKKAAELLSLCKEYDKPISQIMMDRECEKSLWMKSDPEWLSPFKS